MWQKGKKFHVAYTKVNFVIGSKNKLIVEKRTVGDKENARIYSKSSDMASNVPMGVYVQGGSGNFNIELLDTLNDNLVLYSKSTTSGYANVRRFASSSLLPVGTHTVRVKFTDQEDETMSIIGSLKIIVTPMYETTVIVNNVYEDKIRLYNRYEGKEYLASKVTYSNNNNTMVATFKHPKGDYLIYSEAYGEMSILSMNQTIAKNSSLSYTLGKRATIKGKVLSKTGESYSGSVVVNIYNIIDTIWFEEQYNYRYSSNSSSQYHTEANKYYLFEGVPDGKYIIEVYHSAEHLYRSGVITVKGGNVIYDMKTNL